MVTSDSSAGLVGTTTVTDPELRAVDAGADFDDLSHGFVPHHVTLLHRRYIAVEQVQVGAADRSRG